MSIIGGDYGQTVILTEDIATQDLTEEDIAKLEAKHQKAIKEFEQEILELRRIKAARRKHDQ